MSETANKNVKMMMGDYKVAMRKMAAPMILSMLITMSYNLVDGIWTSVLGVGPLAAVGFVTPLFIIINGLGNGLGAGASSLIARKIGAKDKNGADYAATQSFLLSIIVPIVITIFLLIFQKDILIAFGAGSVIDLALSYSTTLFSGAIFLIMTAVLAGILRAEGDVKRALYIMALSAVLNVILDPIFMLYLGMGVKGNAVATVLSSFVAVSVVFYWLIIKKDTYVNVFRKYLKPNFKVLKDILWVGIPASLEMMCISVLLAIINSVLIFISTTDYVATYTAGMRIVLFGIVPATGLSMATIPVAGASFGAHKYKRLKNVLNYSMELGLILSIAIGVVVFIFAPQIAYVFSFSENTIYLIEPIAIFLRIFIIFFIATPFGLISGAFFQSIGKGPLSLAFTIAREIILPTICIVLLTFVLDYGVYGVWFGVVFGKLIGSIAGYIYSIYLSNNLIHQFGENGEKINN